MIALGLIGLLTAYVLLWAGFKGTDPRDEVLAALRGGEAPRKLQTSAVSSPDILSSSPTATDTSVPTGDGSWGGAKAVAEKYANIALAHGLHISSEKRDKRNTLSGGMSDHWTGCKVCYAFDVSGSTDQMDAAAVAVMAALGQDYRPGGQLVQNVYVDRYRVQVLYRTYVGGNHYDHIHIGVRRQ